MSGILSASHRDARHTFIKTVMQNYTRQTGGAESLPTATEILKARSWLNRLPADLAPKISECDGGLSRWVVLTGIFDSTFKRPDGEKIIEASARLKLKQIPNAMNSRVDLLKKVRRRVIKRLFLSAAATVRAPDPLQETRQRIMVINQHTLWLLTRIKNSEIQSNLKKHTQTIEKIKTSLSSMGQPVTSKRILLEYVFDKAFSTASDAEKEKIINAARAFQPMVEKTLPSIQKLGIKISSVVAAIFNSVAVQAIVGCYAFSKACSFLAFLDKILVNAVISATKPGTIAYVVNLCPPTLIHLAAAVSKVSSFCVAYAFPISLGLFAAFRLFKLGREPEYSLSRKIGEIAMITFLISMVITKPFCILCVPFSFLGVAIAWISAAEGTSWIGKTIQNISQAAKKYLLDVEGQKARLVWHHLADQIATERQSKAAS